MVFGLARLLGVLGCHTNFGLYETRHAAADIPFFARRRRWLAV